LHSTRAARPTLRFNTSHSRHLVLPARLFFSLSLSHRHTHNHTATTTKLAGLYEALVIVAPRANTTRLVKLFRK
jgi:hypothetical protein